MRHALFLIVLGFSGALASGETAWSSDFVGQAKGPLDSGCSIRTLGRLLSLDTARLVRTDPFTPETDNDQGASVQVFLQDGRPRFMVVTYSGDGGRIEEKFYLGRAQDMVVEHEEVEYASGLQLGSGRLVSRMPSVSYFCAGTLVPSTGAPIQRRMLDLARRVRARV